MSGQMEIESITKSYGMGPLRKPVIEDCSFTLEEGKLTVLIGPSGCGKTTLINVLAGYDAVESGTISIDGSPVKGPGKDRLVVFQETALFPWMTTLQNVTYGPMVRGERNQKDIENAAMELLRKVGLEEFKDKYPTQLSGGMQRRAELVRALINTPKVMMLDEPSLGLAPLLVEEIYNIIKRFNDESKTSVLLVEQNVRVALSIAHYGYVMENGRVVLDGTAEFVKNNEDVKEFYMGLSTVGTRKSYRDVKHYKRRKRWL